MNGYGDGTHECLPALPDVSMASLNWPDEQATPPRQELPRYGPTVNMQLDLHGDPTRANLVVFSDGNHHMALQEALLTFALSHHAAGDIFYTTTPPGILTEMILSGGVALGNLRLRLAPHLVISPPSVLDSLVEAGSMQTHRPFVCSRGMVLLVRKGNPKRIAAISDMLRPDVRLFLSNPDTEKVSYRLYTACLRRLASQTGLKLDFLDHARGQPDPAKLMYGRVIHHREAPQAIIDGAADAAMVFYHLALRYQRIFPEHFEYVWSGGSLDDPACKASVVNCGVMDEGGPWGQALMDYLFSEEVTRIYAHHGLSRLTQSAAGNALQP